MINKRSADDDTGLPGDPIFSDFAKDLWLPAPRRRPAKPIFSNLATITADQSQPGMKATNSTPGGDQ
jgi:hypothetical protein